MEDEKIIDLYWNRDQGAIRHTAEKYGSYCGRIAKNILLNKEDCEECVNDTWLQGVERYAGRETGNFICVFRRNHKKFKSGPIPETAYGKKRKRGSGVYF